MHRSLAKWSVSATVLLGVTGWVTEAGAAIIPVGGSTADAAAQDNNGDGVGDSLADGGTDFLAVGRFGANEYRTAVYVFQLPTLGAGESISEASFSVGVFGSANNPQFSVDLFALRVAGTDSVLASDYGINSATPTGSAAASGSLLLQNDYLNPFGFSSESNPAADVALAGYLNSNYQAGGFLFLGLLADGLAPEQVNYRPASANRSDNNVPVLTLTTVIPEPASLALVALGGVMMLGRRKAA